MTAHPCRLPVQALGLLLAALSVPARSLSAQALVPDTRIQVRQCPPKGIPGLCVTTHGTFLSMNGDTLSLRDSTGVPATVAWTPATRVRISRGRHRHLAQGAVIGLALGTGVGLIAVKACRSESSECGLEVPMVAGLGLALGSLIGGVARTERWETVERPGPAGGLSLAAVTVKLPTRSSAPGIGVRVTF